MIRNYYNISLCIVICIHSVKPQTSEDLVAIYMPRVTCILQGLTHCGRDTDSQ